MCCSCVSIVTVISCCGVVDPVCYSVVFSVDVAGFSLGSSYADKHEQPNNSPLLLMFVSITRAVAQHIAVWDLLSQHSVLLLEES